MELVRKIQEENKQKESESVDAPAPIDLQGDHQQISFSFAGNLELKNSLII